MEEKSIIIIGAGMAGLSAGCYAQMNGYKTRIFELHNNPSLVQALAVDPLRPLPSLERFSAFLRKTENALLQTVRLRLLRELIDAGTISGRIVALDSCPVPVQVRQNNLKTALKKRRFDKSNPPAAQSNPIVSEMLPTPLPVALSPLLWEALRIQPSPLCDLKKLYYSLRSFVIMWWARQPSD